MDNNSTLIDNGDRNPHIWQHILMWIVPIATIVINLPVFYITPKLRAVHFSMRCTMVSLACADTALAIHTLVRGSSTIVTGSDVLQGGFCKWDGYATPVTVSVSIFCLSCFSLDKYLTLQFPLKYIAMMTKRKVYNIIATIWISMGVLFLPVLTNIQGARVKFYKDIFVCISDFTYSKVYTSVLLFLVQVVPSAIILTSFILIWRILRKRRQCQVNLGIQNVMHRDKDIQVIKTLFFMTCGFYIMWLPFFLVVPYSELFTGKTLHPRAGFVCSWLGAANSMVNPLLYLGTLRSYRNTFLKTFGIRHKESVTMSSDSTSQTRNRRNNRNKELLECESLDMANVISPGQQISIEVSEI